MKTERKSTVENKQVSGPALEKYRRYLLCLAQLYLGGAGRNDTDVSDVVQQTFLEAYQGWDRFQGTCNAELKGWLRKILIHNLLDDRRRKERQNKQFVEISLDAVMEECASRLEALAAKYSSPSRKAARKEDCVRLAHAVEQLPGDQKTVIYSMAFEGKTRHQVANELGCSPGRVAGLYRRGIEKLRILLTKES